MLEKFRLFTRNVKRPRIRKGEVAVDDLEFLNRAQMDFGINLIYYPGAGVDRSLLRSFMASQVVHLDKRDLSYNPYFNNMGIAVQGDFYQPPFRDGVFDAAFIKDIHLQRRDIGNVTRVVREQGILILSFNDCVGGDIDDYRYLRETPNLREARPGYFNKDLVLFQKIKS